MAKRGQRASASSVKRVPEKPSLPYRRFVDRPSTIFVNAVVKELKEHARPEWIDALYRNQISKNVTFFKLREIELDGKKRNEHAPCPMCSSNRFLRGAFIYIPTMQCCAVIGHCCADKEAQAAADREFRARNKRDYEETYLLENLCLVPARLQALEALKPAVVEARRLYRQFRKEASKVQFQLRQVKRNYGGRLLLHEIIRGGEDDEDNDYVGPSGFRGRGNTETREHIFGTMDGSIATINNYDPVKELETVIRQLSSIDEVPTENALIDFITRISVQQRTAGVAIMTEVDRGVYKLVSRLKDFLSFFTRDNAERLNAFGTSPHNSFPFEASYGLLKGLPALAFKHRGYKCVLQLGKPCHPFSFSWPGKYPTVVDPDSPN
jgi:hypothetical protein